MEVWFALVWFAYLVLSFQVLDYEKRNEERNERFCFAQPSPTDGSRKPSSTTHSYWYLHSKKESFQIFSCIFASLAKDGQMNVNVLHVAFSIEAY